MHKWSSFFSNFLKTLEHHGLPGAGQMHKNPVKYWLVVLMWKCIKNVNDLCVVVFCKSLIKLFIFYWSSLFLSDRLFQLSSGLVWKVLLLRDVAAALEASPPRRSLSFAANIKTKRTLGFIQAFCCRHPADIRGPLVAFSCRLRPPRLRLCVQSQDEEKWPDGSAWTSCRVFILKWRAQLGQNKQAENGWCVPVMLLPVCWFKGCSCRKKVSESLQSSTGKRARTAAPPPGNSKLSNPSLRQQSCYLSS